METRCIPLIFLIAVHLLVGSNSETNYTSNNESTTIEESTSIEVFNETQTLQDNETITSTEALQENDTTSVTTTFIETTTQTSLPQLPEVFQAKIRVTSISYPFHTYNAIVSYDLQNNRAAITKEGVGRKSRRIYNFKRNRILDIEDGKCVVNDILENSTYDIKFPFPFRINNRRMEMKGPLSLFRLDNNDTEVAKEEIFVSGVPCREFNSTFDLGYVEKCKRNIECRIRQFVSNPVWKNPNCEDTSCNPTPIRIEIECGENPLLCYYLHTVISFLEVHEGIKNEEEFQPPPGVYCAQDDVDEWIPTISSSFHTNILERNFVKNDIKNEKIWWNEAEKVLRVDTVVGNEELISVITDYNANSTYNITAYKTACKVGHSENEPSVSLLIFGSSSRHFKGVERVGKRKCELSECEVWTVQTDLERTFDIYLNKQNSTSGNEYIPVIVDRFQNENTRKIFYSRREFNDYKPILGDWSAFDMEPCVVDGSATLFELIVRGEIGENWKQPSFRQYIHNSLRNYSKLLSPLRIQKLQIVPENNDTVIVKGTIVDLLASNLSSISSTEAIKNMRAQIKQEQPFGNDERYQLKVIGFSVTNDKTTSTGGKGYGAGDMGGLAVGMLMAGMTCGAAIILIIMRIRMKRKTQTSRDVT